MANDNVTKEQYDALKEDLASVRADFKSLMSAVAEDGKAKTQAAKNTAAQGLNDTMGRLEDTYGAVKSESARAGQECYEKMCEHPVATLAVTFDAGLIIGKILTDK